MMIGECLDRESEFGIIWLSDDGLRDVGCTARIERVLERFDDGRLNILVEGAEPFRLVRRIDDLPYPAGEVTLLDDELDGDAETLDARAEHLRRPRGARHRGPARGGGPGPPRRLRHGGHAGRGAGRQAVAAGAARGERPPGLPKELFAAAIERIELVEKAAERSRGNGSMHS